MSNTTLKDTQISDYENRIMQPSKSDYNCPPGMAPGQQLSQMRRGLKSQHLNRHRKLVKDISL